MPTFRTLALAATFAAGLVSPALAQMTAPTPQDRPPAVMTQASPPISQESGATAAPAKALPEAKKVAHRHRAHRKAKAMIRASSPAPATQAPRAAN